MAETPRKTVRVPDHVWDAARKKAEATGTTVSDVVRKSLERWVERRTRKLS